MNREAENPLFSQSIADSFAKNGFERAHDLLQQGMQKEFFHRFEQS